MTSLEPDDHLDALLRSAMHEEADTVMPTGDGLSKIQQRVSMRRARWRFLRPALALGTAAAMTAIGLGAYAIVHNPKNGEDTVKSLNSPTPTATDTVSPTPSTTTAPPVAVRFPRLAIFPFTSAAAERTWEKGAANGHMPWAGDPKAVALFWVQNYLQLPQVTDVLKTTSTPTTVDVTLGRTLQAEGQKPFAVTVVHEVKFGKAWIVVGATDGGAELAITSPSAGATVSSPVTVSGPGFGVDEAADVQVRDAATPTMFGHKGTGSFGVQGWSATVSFRRPTSNVGAVVVMERSAADGLPSRLAVVQVRFAQTSTGAPPPYFYSIKNGRVTKFHSSDGSSVSYLTGSGASDPQLVDGDVYFLQSETPCSDPLMRVPAQGGSTHLVLSPDGGFRITGYSVIAGPWIAMYEESCASGSARLVTISSTGQRHVVKFPSQPPAITGDPSFEPTAGVQYLDAIVRTGTQAYLARYNATSGSSTMPAQACPGFDNANGMAYALETDVAGTMWFAVQTGSSMQVISCAAGGNTAIVAFTIAGNRTPADVDVTSTGAVLVTDINGNIWRWDGSGMPTKLSPSVSLTQVTW